METDLNDQQEALRKFDYDPQNGHLIWKEVDHNRWKCLIGKKAGYVFSNGYCVVYWRKKQAYTHRIIWLMHYGYWPTSIDHINHDKTDNRLENLRDTVGSLVQSKNFSRRYDNKSGMTGVHYDKSKNLWVASIKVNYIIRRLGRFKTIEEAKEARRAANLVYGFHENHGN